MLDRSTAQTSGAVRIGAIGQKVASGTGSAGSP
jgi:hypothetical protein